MNNILDHLYNEYYLVNRVVVLGGSGFIGRHVTNQLTQQSIDVLSLSSKEVDLAQKSSISILRDILRKEDTVVFISANVPCKTRDQLMQNLAMGNHFAEVLQQNPVAHCVYVSSDAVYGMPNDLVDETTPTNPNSLHGTMHLAREKMLQTLDIPLAIVRPSLVYGYDDPHNGYGPNRFFRQACEQQDILLFGEGKEKRDHVYIDDVASLITQIICLRSQGILNIATGQSHSFYDVATTICSLFATSSVIKKQPQQNAVTHVHFSPVHFLAAFPQFSYTSLESGITTMLEQAKSKI